ncbi:MAG TPA: amino acid racemase [Thermoanaerobaculia bacterium]|jgi:aspartate racemase|nr:amino acid racemase [Thermoanaerobaculia bacterium]
MKTLGILGGMGPLASAEFLRTIYDLNLKDPEQDSPLCVLLSDPTIPDRTQAILEGSEDLLLARLCQALQTLSSIGAERIVIACVTAHHFLPHVPEPLRRKIVSLIDLVIDEVLAIPRRYLLLTTKGTRAAGVFERHERWSEIARWIVHPGSAEQRELHEQLYLLKKAQEPSGDSLGWLEGLASRHAVEGIIFGCTELHLLSRPLSRRPGRSLSERTIDPLLIVARDLEILLNS